jgi:hypothetical protein
MNKIKRIPLTPAAKSHKMDCLLAQIIPHTTPRLVKTIHAINQNVPGNQSESSADRAITRLAFKSAVTALIPAFTDNLIAVIRVAFSPFFMQGLFISTSAR